MTLRLWNHASAERLSLPLTSLSEPAVRSSESVRLLLKKQSKTSTSWLPVTLDKKIAEKLRNLFPNVSPMAKYSFPRLWLCLFRAKFFCIKTQFCRFLFLQPKCVYSNGDVFFLICFSDLKMQVIVLSQHLKTQEWAFSWNICRDGKLKIYYTRSWRGFLKEFGPIPHICHFFTQVKFLENKNLLRKTPIFRVKSVKI